jgi:hypothetical protein
VQKQGSLQESGLASLLQTLQTERATGVLALENENENETASLYFLFGHLFHAAGGGGQGEDVVLSALSWEQGSFRFYPQSKLPSTETIKSSPSDLIAEAERRVPAYVAAMGAEETAPWPGPAVYSRPEPERYENPDDDDQASQGYPWPAPAGQPGVAPDDDPWDGPMAEPAVPPPAAEPPAPHQFGGDDQVPPIDDAYFHATLIGHAPVPAAAQGSSEVRGAPSAPPLDIFYPLPSGQAQYQGLRSAFVDFPKLLRTLQGDQQTGYVRLTDGTFSGVLLFQQGGLLEALSSEPGAQTGQSAFQAVRRSMDAGIGTFEVIDLANDTVESLARLLSAPLLYTGLLGRFVNFDALLSHLTEEKVDGAVVVMGSDDIGIILLTQGQALGTYTRSNPALSTATSDVARIAEEKTARIEVKSGAGTVPVIDFESALSRAD